MSVKDALNTFAISVTSSAKRNLKNEGKNASSTLYKSIGYDLNVSKNSFELSIEMEDYGKFVDKGVKGVGGTKADGARWKKKRVVGSPYSYKSKMPPSRAFDRWSVRRGIAGRTKKGQFVKRKSLNFAIAKSAYHTGIETTNFLTAPFEKEFKDLPDELVEAYGLEVEDFLQFAIQ